MKKVGISFLCILIILLTFVPSVYGASYGVYGAKMQRESGVGLKAGTGIVWKIVRYTGSTLNGDVAVNGTGTIDWNETVYCIKAGVGFGSSSATTEEIEAVRVNYTSAVILEPAIITTETTSNITLAAELAIVVATSNDENAVIWLADHIYMPKYADADGRQKMKDKLLSEAFAEKIASGEFNSIADVALTDDDIEAVQQLAFWYFTNSDEAKYHISTLPSIEETTDGSYFDSISWERQEDSNTLYQYLIKTAAANAGTYANIRHTANITVEENRAKVVKTNGKVLAGPFSVTVNRADDIYDLELAVTADGSTVSNYTILGSDKTTEITDLADLNGDIYIQINQQEADQVDVSINGAYVETTITKKEAGENEQPIIVIEKQMQPLAAVGTALKEKEFDLSLRKYITKINDEAVSRIPNIDTSSIETSKTATYKHPKNPLQVEKGYTVTYAITIYNEGEKAGRATKIVDLLPEGLKYKNILTSGYTVVDENNKLTITKTGTNNLAEYTGGELASETIEIECEVVGAREAVEKVLTNIAWIAEEYDAVDNITIIAQEGADRDSVPSNAPTDTTDSYKGNSQNKEDLSDAEYFYKGEEDDDDFEKVIIPSLEDGSYNINLIKIDEAGNAITSSIKFSINSVEQETVNGQIAIEENKSISKDNVDTIDTYTIAETVAPTGYNKFDGSIELNVHKTQDGTRYVLDTANTTVTVKDVNGEVISQNVPVIYDITTNTITIKVKNTEVTGNYGINLIKVDEAGDAITSSSKFTVNGVEKETTDGEIAVETNKAITKDNVAVVDTYTIAETVAPTGYNMFEGSIELNVHKKQEGTIYVVDTENTTVTVKDVNGEVISENIPVIYDITTNTITIKVKNTEVTGGYGINLIKVDEAGDTITSSSKFTVNGVEKETTDGEIAVETNKAITKDNVSVVDTYTITETIAPTGYNMFDGSIELNVHKKQDGTNYVVDTTNTTVTVKDVNGEAISENIPVIYDITTNTITIKVKNTEVTGNYGINLIKVDEAGNTITSSSKFSVNGVEKETTDGAIAVETNKAITKDNVAVVDTYTIAETVAPTGYNMFDGSIELNVHKKQDGTIYVVDTTDTTITVKDVNGEVINENIPVIYDITTNTITIKVKNTEVTGNYGINLIKVDEAGDTITSSSKFTINGVEKETTDGEIAVETNKAITKDNVSVVDTYTIAETIAPTGYNMFEGSIELNVHKKQDGTIYVVDTTDTTITVKDVNGEVISENVPVIYDITTNIITIKVKNTEVKGNYGINLIKVDEAGNTITSSSKFIINGTQQETVNGAIAIETNKAITKDNVSAVDTYTIAETVAPTGYNMFEGSIELNVHKKQDGTSYVVDTTSTTITVKDVNGEVISENVSVIYDITTNTITIKVKNTEVTGNYSVNLIKVDEVGNTITSSSKFIINGTQQETVNGAIAVETNKTITKDNVSAVDTYTIAEIVAPTGYNMFEGSIELNVHKKQDGANYILDTTNTTITVKDVNGEVISQNVPVIYDITTNTITIKVKNTAVTGSYSINLIKVDEAGNTITSSSKFIINGTQQETVNGAIAVETNKAITKDNVSTVDTYTIAETVAPTGYNMFEGSIELNVYKKQDGTNYILDTTNTTITVKDVNGEVISQNVPVLYDITTNTITIKVKNTAVTGNYGINLIKVDEAGDTITSSSKFTVNGVDKETTNGKIAVETNKAITKDNVSVVDTYTIIETVAPTGYNMFDGSIELNVHKKQDGANYILDTTNTTITVKDVNGEVISQNVPVIYDITTNTITIKVKNTAVTGSYGINLIKVDEQGNTITSSSKFSVNGVEKETIDGEIAIEINKVIDSSTVETVDTYIIAETVAPTGYNMFEGSIELNVYKKQEGTKYVVDTTNTTITVKDVNGEVISENVPVIYDITTNTITIKVKNTAVTGSYGINLIKVDGQGNTITSSSKFSINGVEEETINGEIAIETNKVIDSSTVETIDTYTIAETVAPTGYNMFDGSIELNVYKKQDGANYILDTANTSITVKDLNGEVISEDVPVIYDIATNTITIKVKNTAVTGSYGINLIKIDEQGNTITSSSKFSVNGVEKETINGEIAIETNKVIDSSTVATADTYIIAETVAPTGYNKFDGSIELNVHKKQDGANYILDEANTTVTVKDANGDVISENVPVIYDITSNTITIKVKNTAVTGSYGINLIKIDEQGNTITSSSKFSINGVEEETINGEMAIETNKVIDSSTVETVDTYTIAETVAPTGYKQFDGSIELNVYKKQDGTSYVVDTANTTVTVKDANGEVISENVPVICDIEAGRITVRVKNELKRPFDLSLRKFIVAVNEDVHTPSRIPEVDVSALKEESSTTANYEHTKEPVVVENGDFVVYSLRIYNEGEITGFAKEIMDTIPDGLQYVPENDINVNYEWKMYKEENDVLVETNTPKEATHIKTSYLSEDIIEAFDKETGELSYKEIYVVFKVVEPNSSTRILKNIAEITAVADENGEIIEDRDSKTDNVEQDSYPENTNVEDDDDFEQVILKEFDLSLRKFITAVNGQEITSREPIVDVSSLRNTNSATYTHPKTPIGVHQGDLVTYTIRVYNEGPTDGYVEEITDNIPEGLEFVITDATNIEYMWRLSEDGSKITTDYLSSARSENNILIGYNPDTMQGLHYKEVKVVFKVIEETSNRILENIAEISDDSDKNGNPVYDRDSMPKNDTDGEDDIDKEYVKLEYFDLALRKFITQINDKNVDTRYPEVNVTEEGKLEYNHPKDPLLMANNDIVIYTIRVYNEGKTAGYASQITDNIPEGLIYLPEHAVNKEYEWELSEDGKSISTKYLSKQKNEENLINPFDSSAPDYRDVQIAFKVTEENLPSERVIINTAEITENQDENGEPIDDEDSIPANAKPEEDDIDSEYLKVKYFDLDLKKWVSKVYLTEDGQNTVTPTNHTGTENPEPIVKVDLHRKKINDVTVKVGYYIQVANEGEIAGYASEIEDYIPEELKFTKEDNPNWEEVDGKIITTALGNTLLQPGESATVEIILTWINDENAMGEIVNTAEILKATNDHDAKDIDSVPNNKKENEDDIDNAKVLITVATGGVENVAKYAILSATILAILAGGIIAIKKYVL